MFYTLQSLTWPPKPGNKPSRFVLWGFGASLPVPSFECYFHCLPLLFKLWEADNSQVSQSNVMTIDSILASPICLSMQMDDHLFRAFFDGSSLANRARLPSVSAPHAASWLSMIPSISLGLHLDPNDFQTAIK